MTYSQDKGAIDNWYIIDVRVLMKTELDIDKDCFNENYIFKMSDKAALNLLNPAYITVLI